MRARSFRPVRWALLVLVTAMGVSCGGSSKPSTPPSPPPAAGHGSPQAAAVGFLSGLTKGAREACAYVSPPELVGCARAFAVPTTFAISNLGVGKVTIRGSQAVVTIIAKFCTTQTGSTSCATNTGYATGQPNGDSAAAFASAYHRAGTIGQRAIPCLKLNGLWYTELGGT